MNDDVTLSEQTLRDLERSALDLRLQRTLPGEELSYSQNTILGLLALARKGKEAERHSNGNPALHDGAAARFFSTFRNFVEEQYGPRCPDVAGGCATCSMWALYDLAVAMILVDDDEPAPTQRAIMSRPAIPDYNDTDAEIELEQAKPEAAPDYELAEILARLERAADTQNWRAGYETRKACRDAKDFIERQAAEIRKLDLALQSLTPGGSEYVNNPERCVAYVREARESQHKAIVKFKSERDAITAECERLREALRGLVDGVVLEVDEKGAGGFLLARLSDARAALNKGSGE